MITDETANILGEVANERDAQTERWGQQNHPWFLRLTRWADHNDSEAAKADVDRLTEKGRLDFAGILTEEYLEALEAETIEEAREELIQVAAVCVAAVESIDRNGR